MEDYRLKNRDLEVKDFIEGILNGNRVLLAKAITLVESNNSKHFLKAQKIIEILLSQKKESIRIGITGIPGVGKSTFIDTFGCFLCNMGYRVAVLAIDPSSQVSKGSIMGDKTRMERLAKHPNSFIRPSPSGGNLGGVNRKTRETIILCEAAGYDVILVETMGVGQAEYVVREMVDFFLLLVITGAGDDLQRIKRGIMELPDLIVVHKADGENLEKAIMTMHEYNQMLRYITPYTLGWTPQAVNASSINETGIDEIWNIINKFERYTKESNIFDKRRDEQKWNWLHDLIKQELSDRFYQHPQVKQQLEIYEENIIKGKKSVSASALELINLFLFDAK
ncbi:methylmalonyl Co-A mutase-associated GTPase MeaB [Virgibacillus sp. 6R]|uniref:methylmalonyl Co-A mutase-associated GTPase MeaB n=1 Tax=Metabacillus sp. 22489 TaxID=3453928 RepID=UPI0011A93C2E